MNFQLKGKKALVLASSKGIGFAIAKGLAQEGCHVILSSSSEKNLKSAKRKIGVKGKVRVSTSVLDLHDAASLTSVAHKILKQHKSIDIFIANSPGPEPQRAESIDRVLLEKAIETNLVSQILLCREFLKPMIKKGFGRIIFLTSTTAKEPAENMVLSNLTRSAVLAYAKTLAREVAGRGITVNTVLTGSVRTDRARDLIERAAKIKKMSYRELYRQIVENIPAGFMATPEQFASAVVYLASPLAQYLNGIALPVDGGAMKSS